MLKLLTDYSVSAQRRRQWTRWSTWMCCIWALNHVHVKTTAPTFYYEIAIKWSISYCWMMNARTRDPPNYHGDDSRRGDWNCKRINVIKTKPLAKYNCTSNSLEFTDRHSVKLVRHFRVSLLHDLHILFHGRLHKVLANIMPIRANVDE